MRNNYLHIARFSVSLAILAVLTVIALPLSNPVQSKTLASAAPVMSASLPTGAFTTAAGWNHITTVKRCAREYNIDWRLVLSIIKQESGFDEAAVSHRGAQGLMQMMPVTSMEVAEELSLESPVLPEDNVRAGVHYFAKLLDLFRTASPEDRIALALAAYNAGPGRIYDAQELAAYLNENPHSWNSIQHILPLLSKRYYSLHQHVWAAGHPRNGYFGSGRQTVAYVSKVVKTYHDAQQTIRP